MAILRSVGLNEPNTLWTIVASRSSMRPNSSFKHRHGSALLVIESMKMETVIRSPGEDLVVKRIVHGEGDVVGSGVELVEFDEPEN